MALRLQTEVMEQLREEIARLTEELSRVLENKNAMLLELDHLTAIAMQMTKKLAAYEQEEKVMSFERKRFQEAAARDSKKLFMSGWWYLVDLRRRLTTMHDLFHTRYVIVSTDIIQAEKYLIWFSWFSKVARRRQLGACANFAHCLRHRNQKLVNLNRIQQIFRVWCERTVEAAQRLNLEQQNFNDI